MSSQSGPKGLSSEVPTYPSFTEEQMAQRVVGVSIEANAVRAAEVRSRFGKLTVERTGMLELPYGAVDWGAIIDQDAVAEALKGLWKQAGFKSRDIVLSLDGRSALTRETEIPVLSESAYRQALRYDLAELVSYPADEAVIDYIELGVDVDDAGLKQRRAIAVAVRERSLELLRGAAAEAKLNLVGFDLPALALDRATAYQASPAETETETETETGAGAELLVHVHSETTTVAIRTADGVQFVRTLTVGSIDEGTSLASELEAHLQTIYDHSNLEGDTQTRVEPQSEVRHPVSEGVKGTLRFIATLHPELQIARLVASGGATDQISTMLASDDLGLGVGAPDLVVEWARDADQDLGFLVEVGAALTEVGSSSETPLLKLITDEERSLSAAKRQWLVGVGAGVVLAVLLGLDGSGRWSTLNAARHDADRASNDLAQAENVALDLAVTKAMQDEYTQVTAFMEQALANDIDLVGIVDGLANGLPEQASLTSLSVRAGESFSLIPPDEDLGQPVGRVDLVGRSPGHIGVADWLRSFESVDNLDGEEISGSTIEFSEEGEISSFSGSAVIVDSATWFRGSIYGLDPLDSPAQPVRKGRRP